MPAWSRNWGNRPKHSRGNVAAIERAGRYDKGMSKRRVTLTLDEDLVEAFQQREGRSLSAVVNAVLREEIESENHRKAAMRWLEDLDAKYGKATPEESAEIEAWLDEIGFGNSSDATGAA